MIRLAVVVDGQAEAGQAVRRIGEPHFPHRRAFAHLAVDHHRRRGAVADRGGFVAAAGEGNKQPQ
jgi:hypothetical protein